MEQGPGDVGVCFVKNLPYDTTDDALEELFSAAGPVQRAFVVKDRKTKQSRGFGYVQFALPEDADRAVEELHRSVLGDRKISVELSGKKSSSAASDARGRGRGASAAASSGAGTTSGEAPAAAAGDKGGKRGREGQARDGGDKVVKKRASGGGGSVRHRLIVRNLAFNCDEAKLRAAFEVCAFVPSSDKMPGLVGA